MGDTAGKNGDDEMPVEGGLFFLGESQAQRPIPSRLRERLERKIERPNYAEREKERDKRMQEMQKQKMDKLREHHEKVDRLSAQARERRRLQQLAAQNEIADDAPNNTEGEPSNPV
ncbi:hypothetical protein FBUS_11740 [Fasciolopsis buskii]|uniref:Uncharacterized protein n=1 Tax=Fasciolopsis buskii TaxID=27845 RepID=A0A8E0VFI8_9TREM|nr:hypothetical protein FBUS_11740 [Fasciolopsis buski]